MPPLLPCGKVSRTVPGAGATGAQQGQIGAQQAAHGQAVGGCAAAPNFPSAARLYKGALTPSAGPSSRRGLASSSLLSLQVLAGHSIKKPFAFVSLGPQPAPAHVTLATVVKQPRR